MKPEPTHVSTPDIVERLRAARDPLRAWGKMEEAADEIERLRALAFAMQNEFRDEIERLTAALREIADTKPPPERAWSGDWEIYQWIAAERGRIARTALEGKPGQLPAQEAWGKRRPGE